MSQSVRKLIEAMEQELQGQEQLAQLLENKLQAMRTYDVAGLESLEAAERELLSRMRHVAARRKQAVTQATAELFGRRRPSQSLPAQKLAEAVNEPARGQMLSLVEMLREVTGKIQKLNRVNAVATRKILGHFEHIFEVLAQSGRDIGLYGRAGTRKLLEQNRLVDALA